MTKYNIHDHRIITTHRILNRDLNEHQTLFGGRLLEIVDAEPSIIASHLSLRKVATVGMEDIHFYHPFGLHDALTMTAYLTGLGNRSVEVFVKVTGQSLETGERFLGYTGFNTYVVVDKNFSFPAFELVGETDEERYLLSTYQERVAKRKLARPENQALLDHISLD